MYPTLAQRNSLLSNNIRNNITVHWQTTVLSVLLATTQAVNERRYFGMFIEFGPLGGYGVVAFFDRTLVLSTNHLERSHLQRDSTALNCNKLMTRNKN